jgi:hypothetical protein
MLSMLYPASAGRNVEWVHYQNLHWFCDYNIHI